MSIILDQAAERPQTHALILAPGAYGGLPRIHASANSAAALSSWLQSDFNNPELPLGSLEVLTTPHADGTLAAPTGSAMTAAVRGWLKRAGAHAGNLAFFYFSGHGAGDIAQSDQLLIGDEALAYQ